MFNGKTHYFDWAIFYVANCECLPEGIPFTNNFQFLGMENSIPSRVFFVGNIKFRKPLVGWCIVRLT